MSIRLAREADIPQILAIYGPYVRRTTFSFEYTVPTREEFTRRFRDITAQFPWLVWEENAQVLGYCYASAPFHRAAYQWCAESSVYLHPDAQGRGIGRQLYLALEALLTKQGYRKLYAVVTDTNEASIRFHEAIGYRKTAHLPECGYKFGEWIGTIWMEKPLNVEPFDGFSPLPAADVVNPHRKSL